MTGALAALALILAILLFAAIALIGYELAALRRPADDLSTISTYWSRWHRGRLVFVLVVGAALSVLYVFLMGDLVLELW